MQRIFYIVQKEFRQILREKMFIGLIFGSPFIQIVILGFAITTDVKNVPLSVVDYDHSRYSTRLVDAFSVTESFRFEGVLPSEGAAPLRATVGRQGPGGGRKAGGQEGALLGGQGLDRRALCPRLRGEIGRGDLGLDAAAHVVYGEQEGAVLLAERSGK